MCSCIRAYCRFGNVVRLNAVIRVLFIIIHSPCMVLRWLAWSRRRRACKYYCFGNIRMNAKTPGLIATDNTASSLSARLRKSLTSARFCGDSSASVLEYWQCSRVRSVRWPAANYRDALAATRRILQQDVHHHLPGKYLDKINCIF